MRVLQINKFFYRRGGAEVHFLDLSRLLESAGHEVIHFSGRHPRNEPSPYADFFPPAEDLRSRRGFWRDLKTAGRIVYYPAAAGRLEELIKKTRPEIAHLHNIYHHLSPSILPVLKKYRIPTLMTMHDYKLICPNYRLFTQGKICERCKKHKYYQAVFHRCIFNQTLPSVVAALETAVHKLWRVYEKDIDLFISPSRFLRDKLREWGVKNKIEALPNFIKEQGTRACPEPCPERSRRVAEGNKEQIIEGYLLYFGRLSEEKGLLTLLGAMKRLPEINLRLVGSGPLKNDLIDKITMYQCGNVAMVGYKSGRELDEEIAGAKAVVAPSEWYENYPLSVLEAMGHGKPVVASRLGGLPEIVRDGQSGLLFEAGNAEDLARQIRRIWSESDLAPRLGKTAREQVLSENNAEKYCERISGIYQSMAE